MPLHHFHTRSSQGCKKPLSEEVRMNSGNAIMRESDVVSKIKRRRLFPSGISRDSRILHGKDYPVRPSRRTGPNPLFVYAGRLLTTNTPVTMKATEVICKGSPCDLHQGVHICYSCQTQFKSALDTFLFNPKRSLFRQRTDKIYQGIHSFKAILYQGRSFVVIKVGHFA